MIGFFFRFSAGSIPCIATESRGQRAVGFFGGQGGPVGLEARPAYIYRGERGRRRAVAAVQVGRAAAGPGR